ncbi:MAG TPA: HAMP domain-containing sensor histidine kinase [Pseudoxanthomonas sp.]
MPEMESVARHRSYRRRLRSRIILSFFLLGLGLTGLFAYAAIYLGAKVEDDIIGTALKRNLDAYADRFYKDHTEQIAPLSEVKAYLYGPDRRENVPPDWAELDSGVYNMNGVDEQGRPFVYRLVVRKDAEFWFFVAYDLTRTAESREKAKWALIAAVCLFSVLSLIVGWWAASRVMSPVSELAARLRSFRGSSERKPLAPHFPDDEVGQLAEALDDYSSRLTEVVQRDREFNADVSHELRTPLAVIRGATELLLARPGLDEKVEQRLFRIQRAEQQCTDLIGSLLLLSRNERGQGNTLVARVAEQLLDAHRAQLGAKPLILRMEGESGLTVDAPESAVSVALGNLIGNAVKYTLEGDVVVRLMADSVEVIDSGPGLSPEDAARLFERGYRGTHAGHSQGGGIGLSIVSRLCELYGWQVGVRPGATRGVIATLKFTID